MTVGIIPVTNIPGWPIPVAGVRESVDAALVAAGFGISTIAPDGLHVGDIATANSVLSTYVGSATELSWNQTQKQAALDALLNNNFDLKAFIRAGTLTTVTATGVGTFLATINNNYRSLRSQIAAAANVAAVNAININSGWPSNP
jgi:hypothetical protein